MSVYQSLRNSNHPETQQSLDHSATSRTAYRWQVWSEQAEQGIEPCFATDNRFICDNTDCRWWDECQSLRVEWGR